jgi:hypothetical protein
VVTIASHKLAEQVQESLQPDISLLEQSLKLQMRGNEDIAVGMAQTVLETGLNLNKKEDIKFARELLEDQKHFNNPEQSFRAIIDAHGRTVAQSVQILQSDSSDNSSLGSEKQDKPKYRRISLRPEIKLGDIPIVKDVLKLDEC